MQKKKGISLIVLVITIIVMIILAATVIISLTGNSVIDRANEAVDKSNLANVQQLASTLWVEARLDGAKEKSEFKEAIIDGLKEAGIETSEYTIVATTSGVTVSRGWLKDGFTVVNREQVLEIGDIVNYDETVGGTKTVPTNVTWKVLGADKDGNLLLMSAVNVVASHTLGNESDLAESQNDWLNVVAELDGLCEPYGYGKGVVGKARSITVEDVDSVTGYDKTTYGYGEDEVSPYGDEVTYSYNGTTKPAYTSAAVSGALIHAHSNGFYYYDGKEFKVANDLTSKDTGTITTLKIDSYDYGASSLTTISKTDNTKAYEMIFRSANYWLASPCVGFSYGQLGFSVRYMTKSNLNNRALWTSRGVGDASYTWGVCAVVTLSSDITFTGDSTSGWNY